MRRGNPEGNWKNTGPTHRHHRPAMGMLFHMILITALPPSLRAALPEEIDLPETDNEAHQLRKDFKFTTSPGHLQQAIDAHTRGHWAASNGQIRVFLDSMLNEIAQHLYPHKVAQLSSENQRSFLANVPCYQSF